MKDLSRLLELLNTPASKQQVHYCNLFTRGHLRVHENLIVETCLHSRSNWNLEVLVFKERGKPEYLEKKP